MSERYAIKRHNGDVFTITMDGENTPIFFSKKVLQQSLGDKFSVYTVGNLLINEINVHTKRITNKKVTVEEYSMIIHQLESILA